MLGLTQGALSESKLLHIRAISSLSSFAISVDSMLQKLQQPEERQTFVCQASRQSQNYVPGHAPEGAVNPAIALELR